MADWGSEFSLFQGIHVRISIRIDTTISMRPMITRFGKQVHPHGFDSNETNQAGAGDAIKIT